MRRLAMVAVLMSGCGHATMGPSPAARKAIDTPVYVVIGDSIAEGQLTRGYSMPAGFTDPVFRKDGRWALANDPTDTQSNIGSFWPLVAASLPNGTRWITTAIGSTTLRQGGITISWIPLTSWQPGDTAYTAMQAQIRASGVTHVDRFLAHLGTNDVVLGPSPTPETVFADCQTLAAALARDYPGSLLYLADIGPVWSYGDRTAEDAAVRAGLERAWADLPTVRRGPEMADVPLSDDLVHPKSDPAAQMVAARWVAVLR